MEENKDCNRLEEVFENKYNAPVTNKNLVRFANNVDTHFMLLLLNDALEHKIFNERSLLAQKFKVLQYTYLVEEATRTNEALHGADADKSSVDQIAEAASNKQNELSQAIQTALKLDNTEDLSQKVQEADFGQLELTDDDKQAIFDYSKFLYESGNYKEWEAILYKYSKCCKSGNYATTCWGLLNSQILIGDYKHAIETFNDIKDNISKTKHSDHDRAAKNMLLNTALFLFQHDEKPAEFLLTLFSRFSSVVASSIHLLRYYIVAAILWKDFEALNGSILQLIQSDSYRYRDAFTVLVETLLEKYDFDRSFELADALEEVCEADFFLRSLKAQISEGFKDLILSVYSAVHHHDDIVAYVGKVGKQEADASKFSIPIQNDKDINSRLSEITDFQAQLKGALQLFASDQVGA